MSLKTAVVSRVVERMLSETRQRRAQQRLEDQRRAAGRPHCLDYFHQADDPYSHLLCQALPALMARYDVSLRVHLVSAPPDWAAPERRRLQDHARADAVLLARALGLGFPDTAAHADAGGQPPPQQIAHAQALLLRSIEDGVFVEEALRIGASLWSDSLDPSARRADPARVTAACAAGDALRAKLGHYSGGTIHYAGEWFWGVDRLHYLEARLQAVGAQRPDAPAGPSLTLPQISPQSAGPRPGRVRELHFFLSFRSPYSYIATERAKAMADAHGAELKLRFVLPMIMRGLPVPRMKGLYILRDVAREARSLGLLFGRIADPVGKPVERGYSLLPWAISQQRGYEYCHSFMSAVWSQGVDAGSNRGLQRIVENAGLPWAQARSLVGNDAWRVEAEANRKELFELGHWGVPSFRVGDFTTWGQDRLWAVDQALREGPERTTAI